MDPSRSIDEINLEFDNDTTGEWEYVMINNDDKKGEDEEENEEDEDDDDGEGGVEMTRFLICLLHGLQSFT